jgi:phthalate 3,4-dioxygenase ferredoxin reductase component
MTITGDVRSLPTGDIDLFADDDCHLCGAVTVNWPKALVSSRQLVTEGASADEALDRVRALTVAPARTAPAMGGRA